METSNRQITFTPDLFEPVQRSAEDAEKITGAPVGFWGDAWRRLKRNRIAVAAGGVIILILVLAVVGPWLTPYTSIGQDLTRQYETPSLSGFWFGTDEFGPVCSTGSGWAPGSRFTSPPWLPPWTYSSA